MVKYPIKSNGWNKYLYLLYEDDNNIILLQPTKLKTHNSFLWVFKYPHKRLLTRRINEACERFQPKMSPLI